MAHPIDIAVGKRLRQLRLIRKITQTLPELSAAAFELATLFDTNPHETVQKRLLQLFRAVNAAGEDSA